MVEICMVNKYGSCFTEDFKFFIKLIHSVPIFFSEEVHCIYK